MAAVATIALYYASEAVDSLWIPTFDPLNAESFTKAFLFSYPITAAVLGAYVLSVVTLGFVMLSSWMLVVIPVIFVLLLMILFRAVQFVVVRVAENPKGPQYALSVLLAAAGAGVSHFMVT